MFFCPIGVPSDPRAVLRLAIAGDIHDQWNHQDHELLRCLRPDALLVVGDLSEGGQRIAAMLQQVEIPLACVLGNHDSGKDPSGRRLEQQLEILGERHCGWRLRELRPPGLSVVGARPGTAGGGFRVSQAVRSVYGPISLHESAERIRTAAMAADPALPLVLLSHCGPTGLGSEAADLCGRDWKLPARDWGDLDLALAIHQIQQQRRLPLVVFGHMHHALRRGRGERRSFRMDGRGTAYLNAACVPRHGIDQLGRTLHHFSWVEFDAAGCLLEASHRWFGSSADLLYEQTLWKAPPAADPLALVASPVPPSGRGDPAAAAAALLPRC